MDNKKKIEIPFGTFDSELYYQEINIPDGFKATIKDNKIILKRKDSEDERIRKEILELVSISGNGNQFEEIKDWLEKQSEKDKLIKELGVYKVKYTQEVLSQQLEKQDEQERVNSPKFKVGDWIILNENHNSIYKVERIGSYRYHLRHYLGGALSVYFDNELIRLWTIQDAKDGDVLANSKVICIYKKHRAKHLINTHINYSVAEDVEEIDDTIGDFNLYPATQEERDVLFAKMTKAGYKWDAEKKKFTIIVTNLGPIDSKKLL